MFNVNNERVEFEGYLFDVLVPYLCDLDESGISNEVRYEYLAEKTIEDLYVEVSNEYGITEETESTLSATLTKYSALLEANTYEDEIWIWSNGESLSRAIDLDLYDKLHSVCNREEQINNLKEVLRVAFKICLEDIEIMEGYVD